MEKKVSHSSHILRENPAEWEITRKRQLRTAIFNNDHEFALKLLSEEIIPRIGMNGAVLLLERIFSRGQC
jgi:hypothetical protein